MMVGDPLALRYNDKSVLESHHVASTFSIVRRPEYDIFETFEKQEYLSIRK
jgi:hypothetical protein